MPESSNLKSFKVVIVFTIGVFLTACLILYFLYYTNRSQQLEFDSEQWKTGDKKVRASMVRILIGKNQDEVKNLLGEPDRKTDNERVNEYIYLVDLGHKYGSDPWYYFYKVRFDQEKSTAQESFLTD
jgi:hypothetical protein